MDNHARTAFRRGEEKNLSGVTEDLIRISVGTEYIDDIIGDFVQSFKASATKPEEAGVPENAELKGDTQTRAQTVI